MLRQIRSTGPMRAPCFRGLSLGHFMLNVYWVLFLCVSDTLDTGVKMSEQLLVASQGIQTLTSPQRSSQVE